MTHVIRNKPSFGFRKEFLSKIISICNYGPSTMFNITGKDPWPWCLYSFYWGSLPGKTPSIWGVFRVKCHHRSCKDPLVSFQGVFTCNIIDGPQCTLSFTRVHKKYKNLRNGHFLQFRTKIALIQLRFVKFWQIAGCCVPVCLLDTLKKLSFL